MADWLPSSNEEMWGIVLSATNKSHIWPSEDQISESGDMKLELSQATIGVGAKKEERNVIEMKVLTEDNSVETQSFPIVSLKEGLLEHTIINLTVNPPVSFTLVAGSGPISLMGVQHFLSDESESDDEGYDADESLLREDPLKKGKKRKMEISPMVTKKAKADPIKSSGQKEQVKASNGEKKKKELALAMAGEDEDSTSNSDLDLGDDFGESSSVDDLKDDSGSHDDDEDGVIPDKPEVKVQSKKQKKKGDKANTSGEKKKTPEKKGGKINPEAFAAVKNKLRSNKTLPKSEEKFKNFVKTLKVSDTDQISELWKFVEKLRKN